MTLTRNIRCIWNGTLCLDGQATCTMAYDMAHGFLTGNFAGPSFAEWSKFTFVGKLDEIIAMDERSVIRFDYSDHSGRASVIITTVTE
jgi:hypothetical protein